MPLISHRDQVSVGPNEVWGDGLQALLSRSVLTCRVTLDQSFDLFLAFLLCQVRGVEWIGSKIIPILFSFRCWANQFPRGGKLSCPWCWNPAVALLGHVPFSKDLVVCSTLQTSRHSPTRSPGPACSWRGNSRGLGVQRALEKEYRAVVLARLWQLSIRFWCRQKFLPWGTLFSHLWTWHGDQDDI